MRGKCGNIVTGKRRNCTVGVEREHVNILNIATLARRREAGHSIEYIDFASCISQDTDSEQLLQELVQSNFIGTADWR